MAFNNIYVIIMLILKLSHGEHHMEERNYDSHLISPSKTQMIDHTSHTSPDSLPHHSENIQLSSTKSQITRFTSTHTYINHMQSSPYLLSHHMSNYHTMVDHTPIHTNLHASVLSSEEHELTTHSVFHHYTHDLTQSTNQDSTLVGYLAHHSLSHSEQNDMTHFSRSISGQMNMGTSTLYDLDHTEHSTSAQVMIHSSMHTQSTMNNLMGPHSLHLSWSLGDHDIYSDHHIELGTQNTMMHTSNHTTSFTHHTSIQLHHLSHSEPFTTQHSRPHSMSNHMTSNSDHYSDQSVHFIATDNWHHTIMMTTDIQDILQSQTSHSNHGNTGNHDIHTMHTEEINNTNIWHTNIHESINLSETTMHLLDTMTQTSHFSLDQTTETMSSSIRILPDVLQPNASNLICYACNMENDPKCGNSRRLQDNVIECLKDEYCYFERREVNRVVRFERMCVSKTLNACSMSRYTCRTIETTHLCNICCSTNRCNDVAGSKASQRFPSMATVITVVVLIVMYMN